GQLPARLHGNVLDLITSALVDCIVPAPGAMHLSMRVDLWSSLGPQVFNQSADIAGLIPMRDEYRIAGFHNHQIPYTHGHRQAAFRTNQRAPAILGPYLALQ